MLLHASDKLAFIDVEGLDLSIIKMTETEPEYELTWPSFVRGMCLLAETDTATAASNSNRQQHRTKITCKDIMPRSRWKTLKGKQLRIWLKKDNVWRI